MKHGKRTAFQNFFLYAPRLEILEDRLPPGDAVLGLLVGSALLGQNTLSAPLESELTPRISGIMDSAALALTESASTTKARAVQREALVEAGVDEMNQRLSAREASEAVDGMADPLAGTLPARSLARTRVTQAPAPATGQTGTVPAVAWVVAPDSGVERSQPVRVIRGPGLEGPEATPIIRDSGNEESGPPAPLFSQGTDGEYVGQVYQNIDRLWGADPRYFLAGRWSGAQGSARALTWSFVPDGLSISSGIGEGVAPSETFARMDLLFNTQGGRATWVNRFQQVFDRWEAITGIDYTRVTSGGNDWDDGASWGSASSPTRGDLRISMKPLDAGGGVLAYNFFPANGDMVLDRWESWGGSTNSHRFLRNIVAHEHGHGMGLQHVCCNTHVMLMEPFLSTNVDGPQHDDIRAAQRHYGDPFEDNNSAAAATDIGTLTSGVTKSDTCNLPLPVTGTNPASTSNCSIDADAEQDYLKFTVTNASEVDVTVTPLGFTYNDNPQNANGTCQTAASTNSLTRANLNVQLIDTNGTTVLATAASQAGGIAESFNNIVVSPGSYYIRVYEGDTPTQTQLYTFSVRADTTTGTTHFGVSAPPSAVAGISENITVTALDSNEQPVTNYQGTVQFSSTDPQATLPGNYTFTLGDAGVHVFPVTLRTAGNQTVTATDTVNGTITGNDVILVNPAAAASLQVAGYPSPTTAGDQHAFTVTASDQFGNVATGYTGTVTFTSDDAQADLPADATLTNGTGNFNATLKTAGTHSITATDTVTGSITGSQSGIVVNPATAAVFDLTTIPASTLVGQPFTVTLKASDAYGNVATGYTGTVNFTSSDPNAVLPADYTYVAGDQGSHDFSVSLFTLGNQSVTATDTVNGLLTDSLTITVLRFVSNPVDKQPAP